MEVLCIKMIHVVGLFMELVFIEVLNSDTNFTCLLNMESVSDESEIRMYEPYDVTCSCLQLVLRVKHHFDQSIN